MSQAIEVLKEEVFDCKCGGKGVHSSFVLKESIPHKLVSSVSCESCGEKNTTEDDFIKLDFGVEIMCDFTKENGNTLMAFLNTKAETHLFDVDSNGNEKEIFSFNCDRANVDCIENILLRGKDTLLAGDKNQFKDAVARLDSIIESKRFKMKIVDKSGYSKVCPPGLEYSQIQEKNFEELNKMDPRVVHKKISCE